MVIKATRIRASAGSKALVRHLLAGDDNEAISIVTGTVADIEDAVTDARAFSRTYALRHFVIAPAIPMDRDQLHRAAEMLGKEFGFDPATALIVEHTKVRVVAAAADQHWHLVVAETDPVTGRVLSSSFDQARHEKIARQIELLFGHPIVPGAHDLAVLAALRAEGKGDLADRLDGHLGLGPRPVEAFTSAAHQAAKKTGVDLAQARQHVRAAWSASTTGDEFRKRLAAHGLELAAGDKPGVTIIRTVAGVVLGAANRLAGVRRSAFNATLERTDHDDHQQPNHPAEHGPDDLRRTGVDAAGHDHDIGTGSRDGVADGRRDDLGPGRDGLSIADDSGRDRAQPAGHPGIAPEAGRTGDRPGASTHDRRGLTAAVAKAGAAIVALSKTGVGQSQIDRTRQHLATLETQARRRIAAAEARPETAASKRLHIARLYRDGTHARHAEALKCYRAAQERLAAHPPPHRGLADRLLGRQPAITGTEQLERDVANARTDLIAAEKAAAGADGNLARVEKIEAAERVQYMGQMEMERRSAMAMLGEAVMARRMATAFPAFMFCGPIFTAWAGSKVERKRVRGLSNPWAVNQWGIPIDFG